MRYTWCLICVGVSLSLVATASCVGDDPDVPPGDGTDAGDLLEGGGDGDGASDGGGALGPVVTDIYQSGSRLEPNWLTLADGRKQFVDWWDTTLNTHCRFERITDGSFRCVPRAETGAFFADEFYADSLCSVKAYWLQSGCSQTPPYFAEVSCPTKIFHAGNKVTSAWEPSGGCHVAQTTGTFYEKGTEVPLTAWAAGTLEEWHDVPDAGSPSPVAAQFIRGADGSYGFQEWSLRSVQTRCSFSTTTSDPAFRCRPLLTDYASTQFVDSACKEPFIEGATSSACGDETAKIAAKTVHDGNTCYPKELSTDYFLVGAAFTGNAYDATDAGCVQSTGLPTQGFLSGVQVTSSALGEAKLVPPAAGADLEPIYGVLSDSSRVQLSWTDTKHQTECAFGDVLASDGKPRCLPKSGGAVITAYSDAACTSEIKLVRVAHYLVDKEPCQPPGSPQCGDAGGCDAPPKPAFGVTMNGAGCAADRRESIYAAGAERTSFYDKTHGPCALHAVVHGEAVYDATEIPASEFPEGTPTYP